MVKAQKFIGCKATTLGVILSIGFLGAIVKAETPDPFADSGGEGVVSARQRAVTNAKDNTAAATRAEEVRKQLEQAPDNAAATRELQQINRGIDQRSQQTYGDADRFKDDRQMQQLATNVANTAKDWPHVQAYADRWTALAKPDSPEWAKAVNTGGLAAHEAGDFKKAEASALRVLEKFPKDKDAHFLYHASKGRGTAVAAPAPTPAQARPAPPTAAPSPYRDPQVRLAGERALGRQQAIGFYNRAKSSNDLGDTARALDYAQAAIRADPSLPDSYMERAKALLGMKSGERRDQLAQAINDLRSAMELWMKNGQTGRLAEANGLSAKAKNANGDYNGAQDDADKAVSYNAGYAPAYWERGVAREALKQKELALADYNKSAALLPEVYGAARDEATARLMAPENAGPVPVARPAESALHKAWAGLLDRAGGGFKLFVGTMGALFVLFGGYVLFFAKENSPMRNMSRFLTPWNNKIGTLLDDAAAPLESIDMPRTINSQFELRRIIGEGGMGKVYAGWDSKLGRPVAIKCLRAELQTSPRERERFVKEARTVALLQHPHIVQIFTIIEEGEQTYIVYEHIEGRTLHEELNETPGRRLGPRRALEFLRQIAGAVDHAHERNIIHRDLKPSNVMMMRVGGKDWLKVMDFGIARQVQDALAQTNTNTIVGTPIYMAPEQARGVVVKESDVFALGITLYELLTGTQPFRGPGEMNDKMEGRFVAASVLVPGLGTAIDAVIAKALAPLHENRYHSCTEFYTAAEAALRQVATPT